MPTKAAGVDSARSCKLLAYDELKATIQNMGVLAQQFLDKHDTMNRYELREYEPTTYDIDDYINERFSCLTLNDMTGNRAVFGNPNAVLDLENLAAIGLMEVLKRHQSRSRSQKSKRTPSSVR